MFGVREGVVVRRAVGARIGEDVKVWCETEAARDLGAHLGNRSLTHEVSLRHLLTYSKSCLILRRMAPGELSVLGPARFVGWRFASC